MPSPLGPTPPETMMGVHDADTCTRSRVLHGWQWQPLGCVDRDVDEFEGVQITIAVVSADCIDFVELGHQAVASSGGRHVANNGAAPGVGGRVVAGARLAM